MTRTAEIENPAEAMLDLTLKNGWRVVKKCSKTQSGTGGCFSVGYIVQKGDKQAYLKALDFYSQLRIADDPARVMQPLLEGFNFERDLLASCRNKRLSRVVVALDDGAVRLTGTTLPVQYIIFELAEGDIRNQIARADRLDLAWALRSLHQIAVGLRQLHGIGAAHQDTKPSNVLLFEEAGVSKVADLGRASLRGAQPPHEDAHYAGDPSYAPPELRYGEPPVDWDARRMGCDAYLLGSMIVWMFTMTGMTPLLLMDLHEDLLPECWTGSYAEVLPYLRAAFEDAMDYVEPEIPEGFREDLMSIIRQLCDPDPYLRGHPRSRRGIDSSYSLERYVSLLNLLATRAENRLIREI